MYGLTLFSTFLVPISGKLPCLTVFSLGFALTAVISISAWAVCGAVIKTRLADTGTRRGVNLFLFLLLLYTAVDLSGILRIAN